MSAASSSTSTPASSTLPAVQLVLKLCPVCKCRRFFRVITHADGVRVWRDRKDHAWMSDYHGTPAMLDDRGRI